MYKKLLALTLALALVLGLGTVAFAAPMGAMDTGTVSWTIAAAAVSINVSDLDLGTIARNETKPGRLVVQNTGEVPVEVTDVEYLLPIIPGVTITVYDDPDAGHFDPLIQPGNYLYSYYNIDIAGDPASGILITVAVGPTAVPAGGYVFFDITVVVTVP